MSSNNILTNSLAYFSFNWKTLERALCLNVLSNHLIKHATKNRKITILNCLPVTCWYRVRPSIECIACPISWKRFSIMPGLSSVGAFLVEGGRLSIRTTTGSWYSPFSLSLPPRTVK